VRTYSRLRKLPGFPWGQKTGEMYEAVKAECEGCLMCRKVWSTRGSIQGPGEAIIRQRPWEEVAIDLIVLNEPDRDGNKNILVVIDSFSRAVELYPVQRGDAETVASCLFDVYNRFGRPKRVRCDGAKAFVKSVLRRFNKLVGVLVHPILPYSPYQNGQVERANQEVMRHLRAIILGGGKGINSIKRWGMMTSAVRRIIMNTVVSGTGCTPNELIYGGYGDTEASLFVEEVLVAEGEAMTGYRYAKELEDAQFEILRRSEEHMDGVLAAAAKRAGVGRAIREGTYVLCRRGGLGKNGVPKQKLQSRYAGPYMVVQREEADEAESLVKCLHLGTKVITTFHMGELVSINLEHLSEEERVDSAKADDWTYTVLAIEDFKPKGPRRAAGTKGRLRGKGEYQFLVNYDLPASEEFGDENPCWQPYEQVKHLSALRVFCQKPDVARDLGGQFYVGSDEEE